MNYIEIIYQVIISLIYYHKVEECKDLNLSILLPTIKFVIIIPHDDDNLMLFYPEE